jgi:hypothetical protein
VALERFDERTKSRSLRYEHTTTSTFTRAVVGRFGLRSMFANPPLAEAALYVCILVSLIAIWNRTSSIKAAG